MDYVGTLRHEVPIPGSWNKQTREDRYEFSGETEEEIFIKRAKQEGIWWHSTNNGLVPRFTFNQPNMEARYRAWRNALPEGTAMSYFYGSSACCD